MPFEKRASRLIGGVSPCEASQDAAGVGFGALIVVIDEDEVW